MLHLANPDTIWQWLCKKHQINNELFNKMVIPPPHISEPASPYEVAPNHDTLVDITMKRLKEIGDKGECYIFTLEKEKLKKKYSQYEIKEESETIFVLKNTTSEQEVILTWLKGERIKYDITLQEEQTTTYLEVKTTTNSNPYEPIYMSKAEYDFWNQNIDNNNYFIHRVYDADNNIRSLLVDKNSFIIIIQPQNDNLSF